MHVTWSAAVGGIERLILSLLEVQGRDPTLGACVLFGTQATGEFAPAFRATGVPLHEAGFTSGRDFNARKFQLVRSVAKSVDVVHMHVFNPFIAAAVVSAGRPIVFTNHGVLGLGRRLRMSDRVNLRLLRYFLNRHVACITHNSYASEDMARRLYGLGGTRSEVVYNGIVVNRPAGPLSVVDPATAARIAGGFVIGTSSRFADVKRLDRLIDGFAIFARAHLNSRLMLVGDGTLRGDLESRVVAAGIGEQTHFTGYRIDVQSYQDAMSVCVIPSVNEAFGLVCLEALALGKPTIVFADGGGLVEIVEPLCREDVVRDVDELARRLDFYCSHPDEIQRRSEERKQYVRRFDIRHTAERFRDIYMDLARCAG